MKFDTYEDYPVTASTYKIIGIAGDLAGGEAEYGPDKAVRGKLITNSRGMDTVFLTPTETQMEPGKVIGKIVDANGVELMPDLYFKINSRLPVANVFGIAEGVKHVLRVEPGFNEAQDSN